MEELTNKTFLVVDDQDPIRQLVRRSLQQLGCRQVLLAQNGATALQILENQHVDMIISDWNMPEMTGVELLKAVRRKADSATLPFLMMTAETDRRRVAEVISSGVSEFLVKPFTPKLLHQKIERSFCVGHPDKMSELMRSSEVEERQQQERTQPITLLVVDDTPSNLDVIVNLFRDEYRVKVATSGEQALKICQNAPPDLILLDVVMPGMSGYEVCQKLKEQPETQGIPVIFLTSRGAATDLAKGFEVGGVDYVVKPSDPVVVKARVKNHLKLKEARDGLAQQLDLMVENSRLKEEVQYLMRHDLKNPLVAMLHHLSELTDDKQISPDSREKAVMAESAAYQMLAMINGSQDMIKMEKGLYVAKQQRVEMNRLLVRLKKDIAGLAKPKNIDVRLLPASDDLLIKGEELLCYVMLSNLLKNAIEAAPYDGQVSIEARLADGRIWIVVCNPGGVPEEIRSSFFEKYVTAKKTGGTGLGTYSAKLMAQAQGGDISLDDSEQDRTTLHIHLPAWLEA